MNTLEELVYYCREPQPVGALLLTGEWGCGKTYLIEHGLKNELKDEAIVIRISLFGISSIEELHTSVKKAWMNECYKSKHIDKVAKKVQQGIEVVSDFESLPDWAKTLMSINWTSFKEISEKIDKKTVILVFDDLERCRIDNVDVLGSINEYCENKKFHTIIVANQDKIQNDKGNAQIDAAIEYNDNENSRNNVSEKKQAVLKISVPTKVETGVITYTEIKEKIIQRTVKFIPDYQEIVHTVIENIKYPETKNKKDNYKAFVNKCESGLVELFVPERDDIVDINTGNSNNICGQGVVDEKNSAIKCPERPYNIRSLKCAINDFYRVYTILVKNDFQNIDRWFYSFASYVISYKAGIAKDGLYGTILSDETVSTLYPAFQNQYMFDTVKEWILHGIWDEAALIHEIEITKKREKAEEPADIVRTNRIIDVDEDVVNEGFPTVLEMAYSGALTLDEYVQFIINSYWARSYNFTLPIPIEWNKVQNGIKICINKLIEIQSDERQLYTIIRKENREKFTEEEWNAYQIIEELKDREILKFSKNRTQYIEGMKTDAFSAFAVCQNKSFNIFDKEMAIATAEAFAKGNNADKCRFPGYFDAIWKGNISLYHFKIEESLVGFCKLRELLKEQRVKLKEKNKAFAVRHTEVFIQIVADLIEKMEKKDE